MIPEYERMMNDAMAEYGRRKEQSQKLRVDLEALSQTALAPRQAVEVTVDAQGRMTAIRFPTHAYKSMPAPELAKVIMATLATAVEQAQARSAAVFSQALPAYMDAVRLAQGRTGLDDLLPPALSRGAGTTDLFEETEKHHE